MQGVRLLQAQSKVALVTVMWSSHVHLGQGMERFRHPERPLLTAWLCPALWPCLSDRIPVPRAGPVQNSYRMQPSSPCPGAPGGGTGEHTHRPPEVTGLGLGTEADAARCPCSTCCPQRP